MKIDNNSSKKERKSKIESDKVLLKKLLTDFWFRIPDYQRSYVWEDEQVSELLEDVSFAAENHPQTEYFLGSMVLQKKDVDGKSATEEGINYIEYDVLDGQQRLTTLILLCAVLRDIAEDSQLVSNCEKYILQKEDKFEGIPSRSRVVFDIRDNVEEFMKVFVCTKGGTKLENELQDKTKEKNTSISNMANAILLIQGHFSNLSQHEVNALAKFLFQNVLLIYVSSEDLEDAFRLFTILNDRGLPLSNSDILKSWNLGAIIENERKKPAKLWEQLEGEFGRDEFERLLSHIRTIYVKEKARENILKEFQEKIYKPKKLTLGVKTIEVLRTYSDIYNKLIWFNDSANALSIEFKNLVSIMWDGLPSTDWIPPLLSFYNKFNNELLLEFLRKLDNKFSGDWITQLTPTDRIDNMNEILKAIEKVKKPETLLGMADLFEVDRKAFIDRIGVDVYGRKFAKYVLLKMEFLHKDHTSQFAEFKQISVEHVLPQNPSNNSKWWDDFTKEEHINWLNKIGNLVLLSRRKNSELSNAEFTVKKKKYFSGNIDGFPNSLRVMANNRWLPATLEERQKEMIKELKNYYK
jgi:uncharacterized protein with ParB-like and HNH nuclease domain